MTCVNIVFSMGFFVYVSLVIRYAMCYNEPVYKGVYCMAKHKENGKKKAKAFSQKKKEACSDHTRSEKYSFKEWLESFRRLLKKNKIFFETVMTLALTVMGIMVSVVSCQYQKASLELQEAQSLIEEQLNMPAFTLSHKREPTAGEWSERLYYSMDIINTGGRITNGTVIAEPQIEVAMVDNYYNELAIISLRFRDYYERNVISYDGENQRFSMKQVYDFPFWELITLIETNLDKDFPDRHFTVLFRDDINIMYSDIKGEYHNEWYGVNVGDLYAISEPSSNQSKELFISQIQNGEITHEQIYAEIKEMLQEEIANLDSENGN